MQKFVKRINMFVAILIAAVVLVGCNVPGNNNQDEVKITISGLQEAYTFNTGDAFNEDILLQGVTIADQNGKSYLENVEIKGIQAIPLNEDGTLKQAGTHTLRLNVVVDGKTVSTKMITVEVKFVMVETNDIIYNGDFALGTVDPFTVDNFENGDGSISVVDNELVLTIKGLAYSAASPRLTYGAVDSETCFELEDGKYYEVSFDARASVSRHVHVQVGQLFAAAPWFADALKVQQYFLLDTTMQSYSFRFQADSSLADITKLSLMFGHGKLPDGYISEVCDVIYDNIKIVEVDNLGADTMAPSISAADKSVYVGTPVDVLALATISDDQDENPEVTVEIKKDGAVVDAIDTSVAGVYNIKYTAKDVAGNESSKEIVLTIKDKPTTSMPIENGEEAASVANGGWIEWHDQNWVGSNVAVSEALVGPSELKLSFQYTSGTNWFGMQLFYTDAAIPAGAINIVMDVNSSAAGKVTIAGQVVELVVGDNHLEIAGATSATGATLSWQFGDASESTNIAGATIVVSSLSINEKVVIGEGAETAGLDLGFLEEKNAVANPGTIGYWNDQWWCGSNVTVSQANYNNGTLSISYLMEGFCAFGFQIFLDDATVAVGESKVISMKIVADTAGAITVCGTVVELVVGENNIEVTATKVADNALFEIIFGDTAANTAIAGGTFIISDCSFFDVIVPPTPVVPGPGEGEEEEKEVIPAEGLLNNDLSKWVAWSEAAQAIKAELVEGKLVLTLNSTGAGVNYSPQFKLEGLAFESGKTYEVEIILASSIARSVQVMVQENGGSWAVLASPIQALVAEEVTTIKFEVNAAASYANAIFGLMLGKLEGAETPEGEHTISISKLSLIEKEAQGGEEDPVIPEDGNLFVAPETSVTDGEANINNLLNTWVVWHREWEPVVSMSHSVENGNLHISGTIPSGVDWWAAQVFYKPSTLGSEREYTLKMTINANAAMDIQINGKKVSLVAGENKVEIEYTIGASAITMQLGVEGVGPYVGDFDLVLSEVEIRVKKAEQGGEQETPVENEYFDVVANTTAGAANNFSIKWKDAAYKVTKEPTKADCGVSVGIVANFEFIVLNDEFVQVNIITGAEPARNVSIVLHTEAGDYKVTMIIEGGAYVSSTVEKVDCTHGGGSEEGGNEETPVVNEYFDVVANTTAGAANNFSIKWKDAAYKVTKEPTKADCGVSVGIVANFEFLVLNDEFVQVNIITGAEPARNVSIVLHTEAGDYKVTMIIEGGAYVSSTVEKVDCTHVEIPDDGEDIVVDNGNLEVLGAFFYAGNHCEFHFKVADVLFDASYTYTVTCEDYPSGRVINQFVFGGDGIGIQFFIDGSTVTGKTYVFNITVANGDTVLASGQIAVVA